MGCIRSGYLFIFLISAVICAVLVAGCATNVPSARTAEPAQSGLPIPTSSSILIRYSTPSGPTFAPLTVRPMDPNNGTSNQEGPDLKSVINRSHPSWVIESPLETTTTLIEESTMDLTLAPTTRGTSVEPMITPIDVTVSPSALTPGIIAPTPEGPTSPSPKPTGTTSIRFTSCPSGASLYIDGTYVNKTPIVVTGITLGVHSVSMRKSGYKVWADLITATLDINSTIVSYNPDLTPASSNATSFSQFPMGGIFIRLNSSPTGALAYVDGKYIDRTPVVVPGLLTGRHNIEIRMVGYQTWSKTILIDHEFIARIMSYNPELVPLSAKASLVSKSSPTSSDLCALT